MSSTSTMGVLTSYLLLTFSRMVMVISATHGDSSVDGIHVVVRVGGRF